MSRGERFDRGDFDVRYARPETKFTDAVAMPSARSVAPPRAVSAPRTPSPRLSWPIDRDQIQRVGQSVLNDRNGKGRPHKGIDIFAEAGTPVLAAQSGRVLRVIDGRNAGSVSLRRAGLFVDVMGTDALVYRYLHLGGALVQSGQTIRQGAGLGTVAAAHTSGLAEAPHLHFEIRLGDVNRERKDYGASIDPLRLLPPLRV